MNYRKINLILFFLIFAMNHTKTIARAEKEICKKAVNYEMCIRNYNIKTKTNYRKKLLGPIPIKVIPFKKLPQ